MEPTCTEIGFTIYECACGDTYDIGYEALGHSFPQPATVTTKCTRCGYSRADTTSGSGTVEASAEAEIIASEEAIVAPAAATAQQTLLHTIVTDYDYIYTGDKLAQMTVTTQVDDETPTTETLYFAYDASGIPMAVTYNGTTYYYVTNLQGDVVAILDNTGTEVAGYTYDAWGNILSTTGSLAQTLGEANPLRYRGYVYDSETGLYYLQSRYYDSELGRFINADAFASTGQGLLGYNMFAYCNNCPVYCRDSTGCYTDGQIHDFVIKHIVAWAATMGIDLSYRRIDTLIIYDHPWRHRYFGFCDMFNPATGEMWELKKNTSSYTCTTEYASDQLDNYISNGILVSHPLLKRRLPFMSIPSGSFTKYDSTGNRYVVSYWDQGNGILRYQYNVICGNAQPYAVACGAFIVGMIMPQSKHEWEVATLR